MPRITNSVLKTALENNDPFVYAHLIKFERPRVIPSTNDIVKIDTDASKYAYITDGAYNISFDDGSTDLDGNSNGSQVYVANKVTGIGNITESAALKISSMSLTLDATTAAISIPATWTISGNTITLSNPAPGENFLDAGFQEDDTITFSTGNNTANNYRILKIQNNGNSATLAIGEKATSIVTESSVTGTIFLDSSELNTILSETQSTNFINRKVTIYKVFLGADDPSTFIGTPLCVFAGIITSANYSNDPGKPARLSWGMKSNWGDFKQVRGRLSSDDFHRALNEKDDPNSDATIRPEYALDLGFIHADRAVDVTAVYQAMETRTRTWYKKKWFKKKFNMEEYEVEVDREADLNLNLQAKYIPLIYGVRRTAGNPIFADTAKDDPSDVFVGEAICEGPIHGILNIGVDEKSTICLDEIDETARSTNSDDNTDLVCYGRADAGTVIGGTNNATTATVSYNSNNTSYNDTAGVATIGGVIGGQIEYTSEEHRHMLEVSGQLKGSDLVRTNATNPTTNPAGIVHEQHFSYTSPQEIRGEFHAGTADQKTSKMFFDQANDTSKGFKLQHSTYGNNLGGDYWGSSHKLLDTAWVATRQTISADETTIIPLDYTVKGKLVECKNYDGSYEHNPSYTSENISNFSLGDTVTIKTAVAFSYGGTNYVANDTLASNVTVKDLFFFYAGSVTKDWRVRWDLTAAQSTLLKQAKSFYMQKGSDNWHMLTYDYVQSCNVGHTLIGDITAQEGTENRTVTIETNDWPANLIQEVDELDPRGTIIQKSLLTNLGSDYDLTLTNTGTTYKVEFPSYVNNKSGTTDTAIALTNIVKLDSNNAFSNADTTIYDGKKLTITKTKSNGDQIIIERYIKKYVYNSANNKYFVVTSPFLIKEIPEANDKLSVDLGSKDIRATNNPAMMLHDYMTSKRYGAAVEDEDIDLDSFLLAAQVCDTPSDITVIMAGSLTGIAVGDVYKWEGGGLSNAGAYWRGTVKTITAASGGNPAQVEFTDCIGKLSFKYNDWAYRYIGEIVWDKSGSPRRITANGVQSSFTSNSAAVSTIAMTKVSGSGPTTINADSSEGNPVFKYSLYDADDVKYWKYLGWDSHDQRWVTRHQCNIEIDTSGPVFNTAQAIIDHFNGIITFSEGKYKLGVKTKRDTEITISTDRPSHYIQQEDIIGKISIKDPGLSKAFNSLSANIKDPQNHFKQRQINFFNSNYLKQDRGIVRSTNFGIDGITNYFNARMMVKQVLDSSRYARTISFKMRPTGLNLLPGEIIQVVDSDLGWTGKYFRVDTLSISKDCLVSVTAKEHNDEVYRIGALRNSAFFIDSSAERTAKVPAAPTGVTVTTATSSSPNIVEWVPSVGISTTSGHYEVWKANSKSGNPSTPVTTHAELVATIPAENTHNSSSNKPQFADIGFTNTSAQTFYYWVRAYNTLTLQTTSGTSAPKNYYSAFNANSNYGGVAEASASSKVVTSEDSVRIDLLKIATTVLFDKDGNETSGAYNNSNNEVHVKQGANTPILYDGSGTSSGTFNVTASGSNITAGAITDGGNHAVVAAPSDLTAATSLITFTITGKTTDGVSFTGTVTHTISKLSEVAPGTQGAAGLNNATVYLFKLNNDPNTAPTLPDSGSATYTFATSALTETTSGDFDGWQVTRPPTTNTNRYRWVTSATASANTATDTIAHGEWAAAVIDSGEPVQSVPVFLYQRNNSTSAPAVPNNDLTYSFASGITVADGHASLDGWKKSIPGSGGTIIWVTTAQALASASSTQDTIESNDWSDPVIQSERGSTGPRNASGYIYYNDSSASSPTSGSAVSTTGVTYNFSTGQLSGGVIASTPTSNKWSQIAPENEASNSNKYWYAHYTVVESDFGSTPTITFSVPYEGTSFTGLVTFVADGSVAQTDRLTDGTNALSFGASGTTQINGGKITTGTVAAARISTDLLRITGSNFEGTLQDGSIAGWTLSSTAIQGSGSNIRIASGKTSYGSGSGTGFFLGNVSGTPKFDIGSGAEYMRWTGSDLQVKGEIHATSITLDSTVNIGNGKAGGWELNTNDIRSSDNRVIIDSANKRIDISDTNGNLRVRIGKL